jgi:hypothetical protein
MKAPHYIGSYPARLLPILLRLGQTALLARPDIQEITASAPKQRLA